MPNNNYSYPLDLSWSTEEMTSVLHFFNQVEKAYESKVDGKVLLEAYKDFKKVVPSKGEEKRLDKDFERVSGYSTYRTVQAAKSQSEGWVKLGK
ncbi:UPF0223 family protein [Streptococcus thoraltensis]|uniref:UPF0223 family protein n=1 Tax=Streptococcus thoraltensis TaxID=55085 RepID=UPI0003726B79|nr:UPF0223 family protein [Streptococcus thoraltensis]MDY4760979.1 UPF0223 family protein [Streptococcus thoraltensis]